MTHDLRRAGLPDWSHAAWQQAVAEDDTTAARRAAIHEAAHAAAYLFEGVVPLALFARGGGGGVLLDHASLARLRKREVAAGLLAGMAAELAIGNPEPWPSGGDDMWQARTVWTRDGLPAAQARATMGTEAAWYRARLMMGDPRVWQAVELIAAHLGRGGALSGPAWHALAFEAAATIHGRWACVSFATWPGATSAGIRPGWQPPPRTTRPADAGDRVFMWMARHAHTLRRGGNALGVAFGAACLGIIAWGLALFAR